MSHDLRGPVAAVQLAAGVVERSARKRDIPELLKPIEALKSATARATRLVDDLVDCARLERGRLPLERAPRATIDLAREALSVAQPIAEAQGVQVSLAVSRDAGAVDCDAHRVLQVLSNLISNALKVMPDGGVLRIGVRRLGPEVLFEVSDTGAGISPEEQAHVFERYWRGRSATYSGSGLGLAIARGIVEAHGGTIGLRSTPGQGATFTFTLPAACEGAG